MKLKVEFIIEQPEHESPEETKQRIYDWLETDLDYNNTGECYQDLILHMEPMSISFIETE